MVILLGIENKLQIKILYVQKIALCGSQVSSAAPFQYISLASSLYKLSSLSFKFDCLCGLAVRVHGYTTEMYCASCEVRTEFIYVM
jgi:hypothetical protein